MDMFKQTNDFAARQHTYKDSEVCVRLVVFIKMNEER